MKASVYAAAARSDVAIQRAAREHEGALVVYAAAMVGEATRDDALATLRAIRDGKRGAIRALDGMPGAVCGLLRGIEGQIAMNLVAVEVDGERFRIGHHEGRLAFVRDGVAFELNRVAVGGSVNLRLKERPAAFKRRLAIAFHHDASLVIREEDTVGTQAQAVLREARGKGARIALEPYADAGIIAVQLARNLDRAVRGVGVEIDVVTRESLVVIGYDVALNSERLAGGHVNTASSAACLVARNSAVSKGNIGGFAVYAAAVKLRTVELNCDVGNVRIVAKPDTARIAICRIAQHFTACYGYFSLRGYAAPAERGMVILDGAAVKFECAASVFNINATAT